MSDKHKELQDAAIRRLFGFGCHVFAKEVPTANGIADALGVNTRTGNTYYIECKASRSDLICEKQEKVYKKAIGLFLESCYYHSFNKRQYENDPQRPRVTCEQCAEYDKRAGDTAVDFYYIMVADGVKVEPERYANFGVLDEKGNIIRKAKRMKRLDKNNATTIEALAHVLVYKAYGKLYLGEQVS